jgi:PAS domain-containing protein
VGHIGRERRRDPYPEEPPCQYRNEAVISYVNAAAVAALGFGDSSELIGHDGHWLVHYKRTGPPESPAFTGYVRDITERQHAEREVVTARERFKVVADEQSALRRVATLVARGGRERSPRGPRPAQQRTGRAP